MTTIVDRLMPRSADLTSVLVIGSGTGGTGPHGWTAEMCRTLSSEGMRVVLAEPNPAALPADSDTVHTVSATPITAAHLNAVIEREKPDAVLAAPSDSNPAEMFPHLRVGATELCRQNSPEWHFEVEVVRDTEGQIAFTGTVEHIRGENIVLVAPAQSATDEEQRTLRREAAAFLGRSDAPAGAYSVRFARTPEGGLELTAATSLHPWSAAVACAASGYRLVEVATRAAVGRPVPGPGDVAESFDHIVVRVETHDLSRSAVAVGRCFTEALHKAERSLSAATKNGDTLSVGHQPGGPNISVADRLEIDELRRAKAAGLSDLEIGRNRRMGAATVRELRHALGIHAAFPALPCGPTVVHYSCYDEKAEPAPRDVPAVLLVGDVCAQTVHAVRAEGFHAVLVTSSPTALDGGGADRMYLTPLTDEDVREVVRAELKAGPVAGALVHAPHLAEALEDVPVLGWRAPAQEEERAGGRKVDVEALYDGTELHVCAMAEHVGGVRTVPPISLGQQDVDRLRQRAEETARRLGCRGALGITFGLGADDVHVLHVRDVASRFASAATGVPMERAAVKVALGTTIAELRDTGVLHGEHHHRVAVLSDGVMGVGPHFGSAFANAMAAANTALPTGGRVFVSVGNGNRRELSLPVRALVDLGFTTLATAETAELLRRHGIRADVATRHEAADLIHRGEVQLAVSDDPVPSRIAVEAAAHGIPHITTTDGLVAAVQGIQCLGGANHHPRTGS